MEPIQAAYGCYRDRDLLSLAAIAFIFALRGQY
jgi:hypothetical protein